MLGGMSSGWPDANADGGGKHVASKCWCGCVLHQKGSPVHGVNQWPAQRPSFDAQLREYFGHCRRVGQAIMRGAARALVNLPLTLPCASVCVELVVPQPLYPDTQQSG